MSRSLKFLISLAFLIPLFAKGAHASVVTSFGSEAQAVAARTFWETKVVPGFLDDTLTGLNCFGDICMSDAGNTFIDGGVGVLSTGFGSTGVLDGIHLDLTKAADENVVGRFIWNLAGAGANAFGFYSHDHDGGVVEVKFVDGSLETFTLFSAGDGDNLFFGVYNVGLIDTVTITTTDPAGVSHWDNFVTGTTVPIPAALPLFISGLVALALVARRRRSAALA